MIEVSETDYIDGTHSTLTGLVTARVTIRPVGSCYRVRTARCIRGGTRLDGTVRWLPTNGSVRYNLFATYDAALSYALGYARRISAEKREKSATQENAS